MSNVPQRAATSEEIDLATTTFMGQVMGWRDNTSMNVTDGAAVEKYLKDSRRFRLRVKRIAADAELKALSPKRAKAVTA